MAKEEVSQRSMLAAAIREDLLDRLDALACEPARVSG
jgi:hypothetical protein